MVATIHWRRWRWDNFGPKIWVWLMDKAFWKNPWLKHMVISTYGISCIQELSTSQHKIREYAVQPLEMQQITHLQSKNRCLEFHKYIHGVIIKLCICVYSGPRFFQYCKVFLVSSMKHSLTCTFLGLCKKEIVSRPYLCRTNNFGVSWCENRSWSP